MPTVNKNKSGGVVRFDSKDWLSGLLPQYGSSVSSNVPLGNGFIASKGIDPHRQPGYVIAGPNPTDATDVSNIDSIVKNGVTSGSTALLIGAGTKMWSVALTTDTVSDLRTISAHGGHSSVVGEDVIIYEISGTKYLFYSWTDDTDGDVGRYDLSATFDDDYMSTVPTSGAALGTDPHPMIVGDDGILYIGDGKDVASFNATTTTFNASALDLPASYIITSFAKTSNYLVIFAYKDSSSGSTFYRSECTAFFWDYVSESFTYAFPLSGNYVNGGFSLNNNVVGCFVQGRSSSVYTNRKSSLLIFDETGFKSVKTFIDNIPRHGGVEVIDDMIYWNSSGVIYGYGTQHLGLDSILSKITQGGGTTTGGMLRNFADNDFYISTGTSTSGGLEIINSTGYYGNALFGTSVVNLSFPSYQKARVKRVKVYWGETASNGNLFSMTMRVGKQGTSKTIISNLSSVTDLITEYQYDTSGDPLPITDSISLQVSYSSNNPSNTPPYLEAVEIYFEYVKI